MSYVKAICQHFAQAPEQIPKHAMTIDPLSKKIWINQIEFLFVDQLCQHVDKHDVKISFDN